MQTAQAQFRHVYYVTLKGVAVFIMADSEGFEPPVPFGTTVFKTVAISQTLPTIHGAAREI